MKTPEPTNDQPQRRRHHHKPADPNLLRKTDAAVALGVSKSRITQLIAAGNLRPREDGLITAEEVDRCRRWEIAWQPDYMKTNYQRPQS